MVSLPSYLESPQLSLSPTTLGTEVNNDWTDATFPITLDSALSVLGMGFVFGGGGTDSERGLSLAPQTPFTNANSDLAGTGESDLYWTLTLGTTLTAAPTPPPLYFQAAAAPSVWSDSYLPTSFLTSSYQVSTTDTTPAATADANGSVFDLTYQIDFVPSFFTIAGVASGIQIINKTLNDSLWNQTINLWLLSVLAPLTITSATFVGRVKPFHTGTLGWDTDRRARVVHDFKTGMPYLSDEAVMDGFIDNVKVKPSSFDPDDPKDHNPFIPPPGEGVVDDDLVDIE